MKKRMEQPKISAGRLFKLPYEALKWELLKTAIQLKVFDGLSEPATAEGISAMLSIHPGAAGYFLKGLTAIDCLQFKDGKYQNSPLAETFLTSGRETSIGETLLFMSQWSEDVLNGKMLDLIRNGPPPPMDYSSEEIWEKGARASMNYSRCGRAQQVAAIASSLPEFFSFSKMLDMGSGPGIMGIAVALEQPGLECVLFDQPAVAKVAKEAVAEYGLGDRVRIMSGDYMEDSIGEGYDLVMANYTLNFYRSRLDEIVTKVCKALNPKGVFLVTSDGMNAERTAPRASVISWLSSWLQGRDMSFETGEIAGAMLRGGFISTHVQVMDAGDGDAHGPVEVTIGRKG